MSDKDIPEGDAPIQDIRDRPMPVEDKVAFALILGIIMTIGTFLIWFARRVFHAAGVVLGDAQTGLNLGDAFFPAMFIAFVVMVAFALVAGDGVVGELGLVVIGFFVMLVFFMFSIAIML